MDRDQDLFFEEERNAPAQEPASNQLNDGADQAPYVKDDDHTYLMKLLDYLQDAVQYGSVVPLTGKKLVDADMCMDIIKDIRGNLPLAIQYADQVMRDRERILSNAEISAQNKLDSANARANNALDDAANRGDQVIKEAESRADKIIKDAEIRARAMVDQNQIKIAAQNEARQIVNAARAEANDRHLQASAYAEDMHINTEKALQQAMDMVRQHRQQMGSDQQR
ncbi:hypothetical protein LJC33_05595 [Eubacteriales bacterium OttesenSCG-928-N13]|nr:hypothetical protein [Eubacteriales bacterium OttesenSCG-928-N13]